MNETFISYITTFEEDSNPEVLASLPEPSNPIHLTTPVSYESSEREQSYNLANLNDSLCSSLSAVRAFAHSSGHYDLWNECIYSTTLSIGASIKVNDTSFRFQKGEKSTKALRKLGEAAALANPNTASSIRSSIKTYLDQRSFLTSQQSCRGTLTITNDPMDFVTASDNANGWNSCMSFMDHGSYHLGVEALRASHCDPSSKTSSETLCAYLPSTTQTLTWDSYSWNSKRWRCWIHIVYHYGTPIAILANRNYPFPQDTLSATAIKTVASHLGFASSLPISTIEEAYKNGYRYTFRMRIMYNDITNTCPIMLLPQAPKSSLTFYLDSDPTCFSCGARISPKEADPSCVLCPSCRHEEICSCCGDSIESGNSYVGPNDELLCENCYCENIAYDPISGYDDYYENMTHVYIPIPDSDYSVPSIEGYTSSLNLLSPEEKETFFTLAPSFSFSEQEVRYDELPYFSTLEETKEAICAFLQCSQQWAENRYHLSSIAETYFTLSNTARDQNSSN